MIRRTRIQNLPNRVGTTHGLHINAPVRPSVVSNASKTSQRNLVLTKHQIVNNNRMIRSRFLTRDLVSIGSSIHDGPEPREILHFKVTMHLLVHVPNLDGGQSYRDQSSEGQQCAQSFCPVWHLVTNHKNLKIFSNMTSICRDRKNLNILRNSLKLSNEADGQG